MGFRDRKIVNHKGFDPLELNDTNVRAIFDRCLAKPDSKRKLAYSIFMKEFGFEEESPAILFDKDLLENDYNNIKYMFGQLLSIHENSGLVLRESVSKNYFNHNWSTDTGVIAMLLHLGVAAKDGIITPFIATTESATVLDAVPTLSPKDPNFPAWWEAHKAEWENPAE